VLPFHPLIHHETAYLQLSSYLSIMEGFRPKDILAHQENTLSFKLLITEPVLAGYLEVKHD
jgi:hypothetical protein